jgi:16S rRNA (guanine(527)-N(7))-methyltransferase RsmG
VNVESAAALRNLLIEYGLVPESEAAQRMLTILPLLKKWNARVNLTAGTDWQRIGPLFREAIWASRFFPQEADSLLDIGSGAGFPAIPIRILVPRIRLEMVESRSKKAAFLETAVSELGLKGASVHGKRLTCICAKNSCVWGCIAWKGLKLSPRDLGQLRTHAHPRTQFWMFHGRELAVVDPETMAREFVLLRSEKCAGRKE